MRVHGRGHHREDAFVPSTLPTKSGPAAGEAGERAQTGVGVGEGHAAAAASGADPSPARSYPILDSTNSDQDTPLPFLFGFRHAARPLHRPTAREVSDTGPFPLPAAAGAFLTVYFVR